jgi:hypothetical protein
MRFTIEDSVVIRDVSRHEVHDAAYPNMPFEENVAAPDVATSASLVVYDKELSHAEENSNDDDYSDIGDGDGDGDDNIHDAEDTKKFAMPTSKQGTAASVETELDVYYGDLRTFVMANFPPITIDLTKLKDFDFSSDDDSDTNEQEE